MLPTKERFPSSFLLQTDQTNLLLDCGHGALARLVELGVDPRELHGVFVSHFHTDHIGDAFNLVHARFVGDLYEGKQHTPLVLLGPRTLEARFRKWREISWPEPQETYPLEFHEGDFEYRLGDIHMQTFPVTHVPWFDSVGIRLVADEKIIVYPGDVGSGHALDDLVAKASNADLLIIESGAENPSPNHFTLSQIEVLVKQARVARVLIVHIRPMPNEIARIRAFVNGKPHFLVAADRMVIEL